MKEIDEKWQMVEFARQHGCKVTNKYGHQVREHKSSFGNELKVYCSFPMYYMSSTEKEELFFDGLTYDEWHKNKVFELE